MSASNEVVKMNHEAIVSLLKGDYSECLSVSRVALKLIQEVLRTAPPSPIADALMEDASEQDRYSEENNSRISSVPLPEIPLPCSSTSGAFALFDRALVLDQKEADELQTNDVKQSLLLAAIVLYNAGLSHHLRGLLGCDTTELHNALRMYKMASCLLSSESFNEEPEEHLLVLALLNNMGHISSFFFDMDHAWQCLDVMRDCFHQASDSPELSDEDLDFFSMASMLVSSKNLLGAPAA
jgi:hypothetical protein